MFQESLVESAPLLRSKGRWPVIASVAAQIVLVCAAVGLPLLHPAVLSFGAVKRATLPLPPVPRTTVPQPKPVHVATTQAASVAASMPTVQALESRVLRVATVAVAADAAPEVVGFGAGSMRAESAGTPFSGAMAGASSPHVAVASLKAASGSGTQHISSGVSAGLLLTPIQPVYPAIAKIARMEGTVVIHAVISTSGQVVQAEVVSGNSVLRGAALDAVRNARYRPYLLNGEPTEVDTTFSIVFRLG